MKPGYRTSEFWFTLVSFIFSGLFLLGIIGDYSHKEELIRDVSHAVESCILIGGQLLILYKYVNGRNQIKHDLVQIQEVKKDDKPKPKRSSKTTNRSSAKTNNRNSTKSKKTSS
jgi:hypothetical protein